MSHVLDNYVSIHAKQSLRLWIRILITTTLIEKRIRLYLKENCSTTLPRFDAMAALERAGEKITMSQLSDRLLVSNGNVTVLINRLVEDGLVDRQTDENDRRIQYVTLTKAGRQAFSKAAEMHEALVDFIFSDIGDPEINKLLQMISEMSISVHKKLTTK